MSGNLKMGGLKIVYIGVPTDEKDVATKGYVMIEKLVKI